MTFAIKLSSLWLAPALLIAACSPNPPTETTPPPNMMLMITEADDIMLDASFLSVSDEQNCQERAQAAKTVFPAADIVYVTHYCLYSKTQFEPFGHNSQPDGPNYYFKLTLSKNGKVLQSVKRVKDAAACKKLGGQCVISRQNLLSD